MENMEPNQVDLANNYIFGNLLSKDNGPNDVVRSLPPRYCTPLRYKTHIQLKMYLPLPKLHTHS